MAVADSQRGYWTTMSPLIVRNHVLVGVSGPGAVRYVACMLVSAIGHFLSTPQKKVIGATMTFERLAR